MFLSSTYNAFFGDSFKRNVFSCPSKKKKSELFLLISLESFAVISKLPKATDGTLPVDMPYAHQWKGKKKKKEAIRKEKLKEKWKERNTQGRGQTNKLCAAEC